MSIQLVLLTPAKLWFCVPGLSKNIPFRGVFIVFVQNAIMGFMIYGTEFEFTGPNT